MLSSTRPVLQVGAHLCLGVKTAGGVFGLPVRICTVYHVSCLKYELFKIKTVPLKQNVIKKTESVPQLIDQPFCLLFCFCFLALRPENELKKTPWALNTFRISNTCLNNNDTLHLNPQSRVPDCPERSSVRQERQKGEHWRLPRELWKNRRNVLEVKASGFLSQTLDYISTPTPSKRIERLSEF